MKIKRKKPEMKRQAKKPRKKRAAPIQPPRRPASYCSLPKHPIQGVIISAQRLRDIDEAIAGGMNSRTSVTALGDFDHAIDAMERDLRALRDMVIMGYPSTFHD